MSARSTGGDYNRRTGVINRLEEQLKSGKKTVKNEVLDLSDSDTKRINKELEVLRSRT